MNRIKKKRWERAWRRSDDPNAPRWHSEVGRLTWGVVAAMPLVLVSMVLVASKSGAVGALGILALLWTGFLAMAFGIYVARLERVSSVAKFGWLSSFVFAAPVALPAFWYVHVWNAPRPAPLNRDARRNSELPDRTPISYLDVREWKGGTS